MPPVIELGGPGAGVICHGRSVFKRSAIFQIGRNSRGPKTVVSQLGRNPGSSSAPADHRIGIGLGQGGARELAGAPAYGAEQRPLGIIGQVSALYIGMQIGLKIVVAGHFMLLAALLPQPHP